jgi:hypothetical protein
MAFATGSQIRPELSAVDYTPFLQAAGQSAQMQAQGIGSAVGGALKGLESYQKNVQEERQAQGIIKSAGSMYKSFVPILDKVNPDIAVGLQDVMQRISDPSISTKERAAAAQSMMASAPMLLNAGLEYFKINEMDRMKRSAIQEQQSVDANDQAIIQRALSDYIGTQGNPPTKKLDAAAVPEITATILGSGISTKGAERIDTILKSLTGVKSENLTFQKQAYDAKVAAVQAKQGYPLTEQQKADIYTEIAQMSRPTTNVTVGEGAASKVYSDLRSNQSNISSLKQVSSNYSDAINEITKEGAFSGPGGALKYAGARALQIFGSNAYKTEADAYQAAASALADSVLAIARTLPGSATDKDVLFLERVASGGEKVASAEALKKLKERVDRKIVRLQSDFDADLSAFGEQAKKGDQNVQFLYGILSARKKSFESPAAAPDKDIFNQADAIIGR